MISYVNYKKREEKFNTSSGEILKLLLVERTNS